jgi:hypothetical protein
MNYTKLKNALTPAFNIPSWPKANLTVAWGNAPGNVGDYVDWPKAIFISHNVSPRQIVQPSGQPVPKIPIFLRPFFRLAFDNLCDSQIGHKLSIKHDSYSRA